MGTSRSLHLAVLTLLLAASLVPLWPAPRAASPADALATMPPHPQLLERWLRQGTPLPDFMTDPTYFSSRGINRPFRRSTPLQGQLNALAVVVDFSDKVRTVTASYFDTLIFAAPVGGRGSVRDYFNEVTYAQVDIVTVNLPSSLGWVRAPSTLAYYVSGGNYGMGSYPNNCQKLAEDIVDAVDSVVNFSNYDNDGDGFMEPIMLVHAGRGAEFTGLLSDIWSHSWSLYTPRNLDGVTIQDYVIMPEYWATVSSSTSDMTIGVFAHEMGHGFWGLPDLYDYDGSSWGDGDWSLMAYGSWNGPNSGGWGTDGSSPAWPDAWSRIWAGFDTYSELLAPSSATFQPVEPAYGNISRMKTSPLRRLEYFLLENRQRVPGTYDEYLPGAGLLIWHIDDALAGYGPNNNECRNIPHCSGACAYIHYLVALEQADGADHLEYRSNQGDAADPFPGTSNRTFWQAYSANPGVNPESNSWFDTGCSTDSCVDLTNIACTYPGNCVASVNLRPGCSPEGDLGDAPASQNNSSQPMTAYRAAGSLPAVPANFPTVYLPLATTGPRHLLCQADSFLGAAATGEFNADQLPDWDGAPNISPTLDLPDLDSLATAYGRDDGLPGIIPLAHCATMMVPVTVTVATPGPIVQRYLNIWYDGNRDGDWADTLTCPGGSPATEWAVKDQLLLLGQGVYPYFPTNPFTGRFTVAEDAPLESWLRVSIAEQPSPAPHDGRGPAVGYEYGETEDYYLWMSPSLNLTTSASAPLPPGGLVTLTVRYDGAGNAAALAAVIANLLPPDLSYVSSNPPGNYDAGSNTVTWTVGVQPGAPGQVQVVAQLLADQEPCERITSTAYLLWGGGIWKRDAVGFDEGCAAGDPQAAFTFTVPACPNEVISFTNLSTGTTPISFFWDLDGDGLVDSTAQDPTWVYTASANYTVVLTASNCCGLSVVSDVVSVLQPLEAVAVDGPLSLRIGEPGVYTALPTPPDASNPSYAWDNGASGITATYSWGLAGSYTVAVTASNACGWETATLDVLVSGECISLTAVSIAGPPLLLPGVEGTYLASPAPPTATNPAYLWSSGVTGDSAVFSWTLPGLYTVAVTATNCVNAVVHDEFSVRVGEVFWIYLPLVIK